VKDLLIRADATGKIGTGHVMRCLALAEAWQRRGGRAVFLGHCESESLRSRISSGGFDFIPLEKCCPDPLDIDHTINILHKLNARPETRNTWLVADGYHYDDVFQRKVTEAGYPLLLIDDYGQSRHCYADIVLNQNMLASSAFYPNREPHALLLLGPSYALIRQEFLSWRDRPRRISDVARKILITMGGADPGNVTLEVLRVLRQLEMPGTEIRVVMGHTNPNCGQIREECDHTIPNLQFLFSAENMPELMAWADLAIIQAGGTLWELLFMGCAVISYATSQLQEDILKALEGMNILKYQGYSDGKEPHSLLSAIYEMASNKERREEISRLGMNIVDGQGAARVLDRIHQLSIS
jgi:UDP-2,4-diacetamido-2,4,6-trideoxy-beta-L-altropyranose hydrolase